MPLFRQLELEFVERTSVKSSTDDDSVVVGQTPVRRESIRLPIQKTASGALALQLPPGRHHALEATARDLLRANGAERIASQIRVEWNPRLKTCAG
ncbi:MAG TPA: hypothetical protein VGM62_04920, partial [Chthoniobacterales bacterium]